MLDLVGPEAALVAHVPSVTKLMQGLEGFAGRATQKAGAPQLARLRQGVQKNLGFDPLATSDYAKVGIDVEAGAVLFAPPPGAEQRASPVLALGITDRDAFDTALQTMVKRVDGGNKLEHDDSLGVRISSLGRPFGEAVVPVIFWAHYGPYVLIARAAGKEALMAVVKRLGLAPGPQPALTIRSSERYTKLLGRVPAGELSIFISGSAAESMLDPDAAALAIDSMTSVGVDQSGLSTDTFFDVGVPNLDKVLAAEPNTPLLGRIEPEAVLFAVSRAVQPNGVIALNAHPRIRSFVERATSRLGREIGVDPEKEVLPLLAGPFTAALYLADLESLPASLRRRRSVNAVVDSVHVAITAQLEDPKKMLELLERSQGALAGRSVRLKRRPATIDGHEAIIYEPDRQPPKLGWAVMDGLYVYAVGAGRLQRTLELLAKGDSPLASAMQQSAAKPFMDHPGATVLVLRAGAIAEVAKGVKLGDGGLGIGGIMGGVLELLRTVGDVALAVTADGDGLRLQLRQELQ